MYPFEQLFKQSMTQTELSCSYIPCMTRGIYYGLTISANWSITHWFYWIQYIPLRPHSLYTECILVKSYQPVGTWRESEHWGQIATEDTLLLCRVQSSFGRIQSGQKSKWLSDPWILQAFFQAGFKICSKEIFVHIGRFLIPNLSLQLFKVFFEGQVLPKCYE